MCTCGMAVHVWRCVLCSVDEGNGNQPIHIAAQNGHLEIAKLVLEAGGDVNAKNGGGVTALHMAVEYDYYWTAKYLLEKGADKSIVSDEGPTAETGIGGEGSRSHSV